MTQIAQNFMKTLKKPNNPHQESLNRVERLAQPTMFRPGGGIEAQPERRPTRRCSTHAAESLCSGASNRRLGGLTITGLVFASFVDSLYKQSCLWFLSCDAPCRLCPTFFDSWSFPFSSAAYLFFSHYPYLRLQDYSIPLLRSGLD